MSADANVPVLPWTSSGEKSKSYMSPPCCTTALRNVSKRVVAKRWAIALLDQRHKLDNLSSELCELIG